MCSFLLDQGKTLDDVSDEEEDKVTTHLEG